MLEIKIIAKCIFKTICIKEYFQKCEENKKRLVK